MPRVPTTNQNSALIMAKYLVIITERAEIEYENGLTVTYEPVIKPMQSFNDARKLVSVINNINADLPPTAFLYNAQTLNLME